MEATSSLLPHVATLINTLRFLGIDPVIALAAALSGMFTYFMAPAIRGGLMSVEDYVRKTPSKADDAVIPILDSLEERLGDLKAGDAGVQDVAKVMAKGILDASANKKDAKKIAARVVYELGTQINKHIAEMGSSSPAESPDPNS